MGSAGEKTFHRKSAAPPLLEAVQQLSRDTGQPVEDFEERTLEEIFQVVQQEYGPELPHFWLVWNSWNTHPDITAEMGDL